MKVCLILLSAAVVVLALALARLARLLTVARGENLRLREIVTLNSKYSAMDLEELRRLRHDMRHYAITADAVSAAAGSDAPGSSVIRSLVEYYRGQARSVGASADLVLDLDSCGDELVPDLCLVVSNLLENAVEALQGQEHGWLRARSRCTDGYVTLVVGNSCTAAPRRRRGAFMSTKAPGRSGIGLATVYDVAHNYDGRAVFTADGNQFMASVFLTLPTCTAQPASRVTKLLRDAGTPEDHDKTVF